MIRRHATCDCTRSATFVFRFNTWKLAISHEASYAVAYAGGCCHPPLAGSAFACRRSRSSWAFGSIVRSTSCGRPQDSHIIVYCERSCQIRGRYVGEPDQLDQLVRAVARSCFKTISFAQSAMPRCSSYIACHVKPPRHPSCLLIDCRLSPTPQKIYASHLNFAVGSPPLRKRGSFAPEFCGRLSLPPQKMEASHWDFAVS